MDTTDEVVTGGRRRRRRHSVFFKAEAVGACQKPGASVAAEALARGLNANMLHRWVQEAERGDAPIAFRTADSVVAPETGRFLPVSLPTNSSPAESRIQIELRRGEMRLSLQWPTSHARECASLLRALMK